MVSCIATGAQLNSAGHDLISLCLSAGTAPSPEFLDGKINQAQKMNNKVEGTPKTETKSKVRSLMSSKHNQC